MTLCKSRTSNYWNHSSETDTLVNQDDHAAPIRSPVRGRTGFSKSGGLRASVPLFPLHHPLPSNFLLSPHFSRGPNAKNSFAWPQFRSLRTGTLATQATLKLQLFSLLFTYWLFRPQKRKVNRRFHVRYICFSAVAFMSRTVKKNMKFNFLHFPNKVGYRAANMQADISQNVFYPMKIKLQNSASAPVCK